VFAAARGHAFAALATAIDDAFARWDRAHLHQFGLADGTVLTTPFEPGDELGLDDRKVKLSRLASGDPAWVFSFVGVVTIPIDIVERDPICVVINGYPTWFSVGASYIDGEWVEAKPPPVPPTKALPALQP
jgi:hypothetical protein